MKVLFELVVEDVNAGVQVAKYRDLIKQLNKELKTTEDTEAYKELSKQAAGAKIELDTLLKKQKELNREFKATQVPKDSLAGLRIEYAKLSEQISKLSEAERKSDFGKNLIQSANRTKGQIDGIEQSIGRFTGNVGNYQSAFKGIASGVAAFGGALALLQGGNAIIDATRESEKLFAVLKNVKGSEIGALQVFDQLQQFASTTPFQLNEVVGAFVKLEQRNFKPQIEDLRLFGDIAAASNKSIDQFIEAVLDAQTGEFERLKEFGIVVKKNGDDLNVSFRGQKKTIDNTSESITAYLREIGKLPGVVGATAAVSKTLDGSISNLVDNFTQLFAQIGSGGGILQSVVDGVSSLVGSLNDFLKQPVSQRLREQQTEFNALIGILQDVNTEEDTRQRAIAELQKNYPEYIGNVDLQKATESQLNDVLKQGNDLFVARIFVQSQQERLTEFAEKRLEIQQKLFEAEKGLAEVQQRSSGSRILFGAVITKESEIKSFEAVIQRYKDGLQGLTDEQQAYLKEQEDFQERFNIDITKGKVGGGNGSGSTGGGIDANAKTAAGSIEALRKRVQDLTDKLEKAPPNQIPRIFGDLVKAEAELRRVERIVDKLRNPPAAPETEQQIAQRQGIGDLAPGKDIVQTEADRAKAIGVLRLTQEQETNEAINKAREQLFDDEVRRAKELAKEEGDIRKKGKLNEDEARIAIREKAEQLAIDAANAAIQIQRNRIQEEADNEIAALEELYQKKIDAAAGNNALQEKLQKELAKKTEDIQKDAARRQKKLSVTEAIINTAVAVTKALTSAVPPFNFILAGLSAAAGAIQIGVINSQKFAKGGKVGFFGGKSHSAGGTKGVFSDGTRVEVEKDEAFFILNKKASAKIAQLSRLNESTGGRKFATGGALDFTPQVAIPTASAASSIIVQSTVTLSDDQVKLMAQEIARENASATRNAIGEGLNDSNRRLERQTSLQQQTQV